MIKEVDSSTRTGVMLCGHGSRDMEAIQEFNILSECLQKRLPEYAIESGYLEFAHPVIRDGLEALKMRGAKRIIAVPGMLLAAGHIKNDLPWEINSFAADNANLDILYGKDLGINPKLLRAASERIEIAEKSAGLHILRRHTLLLVVGRGTTDPDANSNVTKIARILWEGMGFGWAETAYSGVAYPRVNKSLARIVTMGFHRIIVFPYFLFTGVLVKRIYNQTDEIAACYPSIEFVKANYLNDHPLVLESFVEQIVNTLENITNTNCQLCKYRDKIVGYECAIGTVQTGHHHHVRGIGAENCTLHANTSNHIHSNISAIK